MILPFSRLNKAGVKEQFWTHSTFIAPEEFQKIQKQLATRSTFRNYLGFFSALAGLVLHDNAYVKKLIPKAIPFYGTPLIFGGVGLILGHFIFVNGFANKRIENIMSHATLPLWTDKKNVANLQRLFFHLDESKHNTPDLLYHGLTAENASKIFPDFVVGPTPKAPQQHGHGHGHGHGGSHENEHH